MAAGTQVCRYRSERPPASSTLTSYSRPNSASGFLRSLVPRNQQLQQQSLFGATSSSYLPTRTITFGGRRVEPSNHHHHHLLPVSVPGTTKYIHSFVLTSPLSFQPVRLLAVHRAVPNVLLNGLCDYFSSLSLTNSISAIHNLNTDKKSEMCKITVTTTATSKDASSLPQATGKEVSKVSPPVQDNTQSPELCTPSEEQMQPSPCHLEEVDDEMAGDSEGIHAPDQPVSPPLQQVEPGTTDYECNESDNESCQEDSEEEDDDEYGYESDTDQEEEDDMIEFSDECLAHGDGLLVVSVPEPPTATTMTANDKSFESLYSQESGFCENGSTDSRESWSDDEVSDDNVDAPSFDGDASEDLWQSFEDQALARSPQLPPAKKRVCGSSRMSTNTRKTPKCVAESRTCPTQDSSPSHSSSCPSSPSSNNRSNNCRRVSFKPDSELCVIYNMFAWDHAYRSCRRGPWEQYARDRVHFRRRIESVSAVLSPCLQKKLQRSVVS